MKPFCKLKDSSDKVVYLTFDDGPDTNITHRVLDVLQNHDAKATFFIIGSRTRGNEGVILRAIAEGHAVGNHTRNHRWKFPFYPYHKMKKDIEVTGSLLDSITGTKVRLFRPPFGVTNPTIARCVKDLELSPVGWNIRTFDTKHPDPDYVLERVKARLEPGSVILLHDRLPEAPEILEKLLCYLEEEEYIFNRPLPC